MTETTVISVRGRNQDELLADPNFVYVGRAVPRCGWKASRWANPFRGHEDKRLPSACFFECLAEAVACGVTRHGLTPEEFKSRFFWMARNLRNLRGKTLGCWCGNWAPGDPGILCHAVVLAKMANSLGGPR